MRLIVYAPSVRVGGGLSLLVPLLRALADPSQPWAEVVALLDARQPPAEVPERIQIRRVGPGLRSRLAAERLLARMSGAGDLVLCFGNLPPLFRTPARVATYVQNTYVFGPERGVRMSWKRRLHFRVLRLWFECLRAHADIHFVQTHTIRDKLLVRFGLSPDRVIVAPFLPTRTERSRASAIDRRWDFVYVSHPDEHKNHRRLIEAFVLLADRDVRPSLAVTVPPDRYPELAAWIEQQRHAHQLRLTNLGDVPSGAVDDVYACASAMIFPSLSETIGLPLIEAAQFGLPVLASERDFVRDVTVPTETFDPESPKSIMRAVLRFLGTPDPPTMLPTPSAFVTQLAALATGPLVATRV